MNLRTTPTAQPASYTASKRSSLAVHLLPALLVIGLLGLLAAPVLILLSRPGGISAASKLGGGLRRRPPWMKPKPPSEGASS